MTKIDEIKILLDGLGISSYGKIGIGLTTHNRPDFLKKCLENIEKHRPSNSVIVVVDDASTNPAEGVTFCFEKNVGIAVAKNKTLELLYKQDCDHYFLFDDDTWPVSNDWYKPYCESSEPHLMYIFEDFKNGAKLNDTIVLYKDGEKVAYSHPRGCMLYFKKICLKKAGGMFPGFGKWGFEHGDLSNRIFNHGLTSFRYMDVANSSGLFYSDDEQNNNVNTTVTGEARRKCIQTNSKIYEDRKFLKEYVPFFGKENIFLTCYFAKVKDPQNRTWEITTEPLMPLIKSLKSTRLIILHDCFEQSKIDALRQYNVTFEKVETCINPYFQRWVSYRQYLTQNQHWIEKAFCIDATDVEVLKEPLWLEMEGLYTGDEPETLDDAAGWMKKHHQHRQLATFFDKYGKQYQLLNAGVLGGNVADLIEFMRLIVDFYAFAETDAHFHKWPNAGLTDMGVFCYIARTYFSDILKHGREITTTFKADERNTYSWFKHK